MDKPSGPSTPGLGLYPIMKFHINVSHGVINIKNIFSTANSDEIVPCSGI